MSVLLFLFFAILSFKIPFVGLSIFLIFNSGIAGFVEKIGLFNVHFLSFSTSTIGYTMAIGSLIFKKLKGNKKYAPPLTTTGFLLWVLTAIIFFTRLFKLETINFKTFIATILACLLWAPLFQAFLKMDLLERSYFKKVIIFLATITAFFSVLTILTGSSFLYSTLTSVRELSNVNITPNLIESLMPADLTTSRVALPGVYALLPIGFCFCMIELFTKELKRTWKIVYIIATQIMLLALVFTLTRTPLFGIILGIIQTVILVFIFIKPRKKFALFIFCIFIIFTLIFASHLFKNLHDAWEARIKEVFYAPTFLARLSCNARLLELIFEKMPLVQTMEWSEVSEQFDRIRIETGGDPHTVTVMCLVYGLLAGILLALVIFSIFRKLIKVLALRRRYPKKILIEAAILLMYFLQLNMRMFGEGYLKEDFIFITMFFLSEVEFFIGTIHK